MSQPKVSFSAVVATKGRRAELHDLFRSLAAQTYPIQEVIVVDQNSDDRLRDVIAAYADLPIRHLHQPELRGVNTSRNVGWQAAQGEVIFFPDDDCWYPPTSCAQVVELLQKTGADILSGRPADENGRSINGRFLETPLWVDRSSVWFTQIEWVFFAHRKVLEATGGFDEQIGPGANTRWAANEVQDLSLKALALGYKQYFSPALFAHHDEIDISALDGKGLRRAEDYGRGFGHVLAKHGYGLRSALIWSARPIATVLLALARGDRGRALYALRSSMGRLKGYFDKINTPPLPPRQ